MSKQTTNPGDGERRAIRAYGAQYRVAASLIIKELQAGNLEWIRIADPNAGRVDDIQIATPGKLDAYQIKWNDYPTTFSFNDLTKNGLNDQPNLMEQLADGWNKLVGLHSDRKVAVHLLVNDHPSTSFSAKMPVGTPAPVPNHFSAFLRNGWNVYRSKQASGENTPKEWLPTISELASSSKLEETIFQDFAQYCYLDFNFPDPRDVLVASRASSLQKADINVLTELLFREVGGKERVVEISRAVLLEKLHWEGRFKSSFRHDFPVNESTYQPVRESIAAIEQAVSNITNGYISLVGTPGSGKSTTLTHHFRYRKNTRVIKYYAFIPDDINAGRGEAFHFLHDLYVSIRQHGFSGDKGYFPETRDDLRVQFTKQLSQLHDDWESNGTKTLILIDGLDHVEREQSPERSFFRDLPFPNDIPEGIIIILGTQKVTLEGMPPSIISHLNGNDRHLEMMPLDRASVRDIASSYPLCEPLSDDQKEDLVKLSNGHPLALSYLLQRLESAVNQEQLSAFLSESSPYDGHIDTEYERYWAEIGKTSEIVELLGLVSRVRGEIDLRQAISWSSEKQVRELVNNAAHFFRRKTRDRWSFFHNSFRQFLLRKTGRDIFGEEASEIHQQFHRKLAEDASKAQQDIPWAWEQVFHWASAGDHYEVVKAGSQKFFRNQFINFRPLSEILEDLTVLLKSAKETNDGLAVIRTLLIEKELRDRNENLGECDFTQLILALIGAKNAKNYLLRGQNLLVSNDVALELVDHLISYGAFDDAHELFDAAEPLSLLSGTTKLKGRHSQDQEAVELWAKNAHYFRPLNTILSNISQIESDAGFRTDPEDESTNTAQARKAVLYELTDGVLQRYDKNILGELTGYLESQSENSLLQHIDIHICQFHRNSDDALDALNRIIDRTEKDKAPAWLRVLVAEFLFRINNDSDESRKWMSNIEQPATTPIGVRGRDFADLVPFAHRIRLTRLLALFDKPVDPIKVIPDPTDSCDFGNVLFERMIVLISNVWGNAWRSEKDRIFSLQSIRPAITLFNRSWRDTQRWTHWHNCKQAAGEYFGFLINAVAAHGEEAIDELTIEFESQWNKVATQKYWHTSTKRKIALSLYEAGQNRSWLVSTLEEIEFEIDPLDDLHSVLDEYFSQIEAWIEIEEFEKTKELLAKIFDCSFGIDHNKDDQLGVWVSWLSKAQTADVEDLDQHIQKFCGALNVVSRSGRGSYVGEAADELISIVAEEFPKQTLTTIEWLFKQKSLDYCVAIQSVASACLSTSSPPTELILEVVKHLLVPFDKTADEGFAKSLCLAVICEGNDHEAKSKLLPLIDAIQTQAYPTCRETWYQGFRSALITSNTSWPWLTSIIGTAKTKDDGITRPTLVLKDDSEITSKQVQEVCSDFVSFMDFCHRIKESKYFKWDSVLKIFISDLSQSQLDQVSTALAPFDPDINTLALVAKRYFDLGDNETAIKLGDKLLSSSSPNGWGRWYDGGSRSAAFRCQIEMGIPKTREKALKQFVDDYISEGRWPREIVRSLDDLLPIFFDEAPVPLIWSEISEHIYQLFDFKSVNEKPPKYVLGPDQNSVENVLIELLFHAVCMPVGELRTEAYQALCTLAENNNSLDAIHINLSRLLSSDDEDKLVVALSILQSQIERQLKIVGVYSNEIQELTISPSFTIRETAQNLASVLGLPNKKINASRNKLRPVFQLELPEIVRSEERLSGLLGPEGSPLPDTSDPIELISPFNSNYRILEKITGIAFQNLVARGVQLMKELNPHDQWNRQAEVEMQSVLKGMGLELTYRRPKAHAASMALTHLVLELYDAGVLNKGHLEIATRELKFLDSALSFAMPSVRPNQIAAPEAGKMGEYPRKDWIDHSQESFDLLGNRLGEGWYILGELSTFVDYEWSTPQEKRFSTICHPDAEFESNINFKNDFFRTYTTWTASSYPDLVPSPPDGMIAIRGSCPTVEIGRNEWLAISPDIARSCGWKLSNQGFFRWVDETGDVAVESLWWKDGPTRRLPPRSNEVCGEGWLVVATENAMIRLKKYVSPAIQKKCIIRSFKNSELPQRTIKSAASISEWKFE